MSKHFLIFAISLLLSAPVLAGFLDDLSAAVDSAVEDVGKAIDGDADIADDSVTKVKGAEASLDATEADLWSQVRFQWGQNANHTNVKSFKADVTCDGHVDYVASRLNQDNPDGPFFNILIVTHDGGEITSEGVSLAFDGSQAGLCGDARADIDVEAEHWDEGQLDAMLGGWEGICTEAVRVDDGMCDAPRYFWLTGEREEGDTRLMFHRN